MPFATITNLTGLDWAVPRLNLVLSPGAASTVYLEDADGFLGDLRITTEIAEGRISVVVSSTDPGGAVAADEVGLVATGFAGNLSAADTNVQLMAATVDALAPGGDVSGTIAAMSVDAIAGVTAVAPTNEGELLQFDLASGDYIATAVPWCIKSGTVLAGAFAGGPPLTAAVAFGTAWPDANYAVSLCVENNGTFTGEDPEVQGAPAVGGFTIEINSVTNVTAVRWTATRYYNP